MIWWRRLRCANLPVMNMSNSLVNDVEVCMKEAGIEATVDGTCKTFLQHLQKDGKPEQDTGSDL